ncbi:MAG TPA: hypothetical protein VGC87_01525 [Pyrinomonadaceae bacterium]|jgi:hypothetical protein
MPSLQPLLDALGSLVLQAPPLRLRRDGRDPSHLVADLPLTRAAAIEWLWRGRVQPPAERFKADPAQGPPDGPQRRFLFKVTPDEFVEARQDFKDQYLKDGPGLTLARQLNAIVWLPQALRQQLLNMDSRGELFRSDHKPVVKVFPGQAPWGNIVAWAGPYEFRRWNTLEIFQYFPAEKQFYVNLLDDNFRGNLLYLAYKSFNADIQYFVEQKLMRPTDAREEMFRINVQVFKALIQAWSDVISGLAGQAAANSSLKGSADSVTESVLESFRAKRRAFGMVARRSLPTIVMFRGTTMRWKTGNPGVPADLHDLGIGCYFTTDSKVAAQYAEMRGTIDDPAIILSVDVAKEELGHVLDLVNGPHAKRWDELVGQVGASGMANETYNKLFKGFLEEIGETVDSFDTIIGREYLRGGVQINIRRSNLLDSILLRADEIWRAL